MSPCDVPSYASDLKLQMAMDKDSMKAREALSTVCSSFFVSEFGPILAEALRNGMDEAEIICRSIGIGEREMAALVADEEWFCEVVYDL